MLQPVNSIIPPDLLLRAYRAGIFPMADSRDDPDVYWVEPRLRAILPLDGFHCSHSLARTLRRGRFTVTCNAAFDAVIDSCAAPRDGAQDSWISQRIRESYRTLHTLGHAHSIETWATGPDGRRTLVGGLYGVGFARVFCGESMFSRQSDASKVALAWLVAALRHAGVVLLDCQFSTPHLASLGAVEIPQADYLARLDDAGRYCVGESAGVPPSSITGASSAGALSSGSSAGAAAGLPAGFAALLAAAAEAGLSSSPGNFIAQFLTQTS
ncbi:MULTISPECIES: leucyl/phenylalanyl-tRNA--protein transferase [Novosphingobium]|uniref:leucyl/phenylalanyl-tRNA--protein transferase n=1 Tax=Novosphingobium TaxID=165696 RepID=UPI0014941D1D|nr:MULTISPECIES: leucyl/phenylalanyl-tRNA--protein transferase [Novosphingobium]MBB3359354.1 leucyl/phenylalanyl-tRNA--protein transferase [Novosphingobium sp. BK256]MBB3375714.1 leucyl/phenylalanyl-tRNA--protein transferase [Novosphingobium sp. BK280]MBB3380127.1 leucyl/phenylalanyl-tRNA--protein transferase [Novosphingobium sp. BK258]MBB3421821.1 leucyl/phenylalanyl-tRNA--protein transferase [Novosphingobium sp. BK267]MBB3450477.1 leucyl/phenylalanyl-tRNA--protein transferase [Novosphingobiu